jgi:ribose/xylose/arabinose/galactoside ABC-type transport system permease subunit
MKRALRYTWRLVVVVAIIAAIVGLGYLWRGSSAASLVSDGRDRRPGFDGVDRFRERGSSVFGLSNIDDLLQTVLIGVVVLGVVVAIDRLRRRRKPIRSSASL